MTNAPIVCVDPEDLVSRFAARAPTLNLFPTENRMSPAARAMLGSDVVARYPGSEGPGYLYGDPEGVADLYDQCEALACRYFGVERAFVQFLSGLHAMQSMVSTLPRPGELITVLGPNAGGHYATEQICRDFGHDVAVMPFDRRELRIDLDALHAQARARPCGFYYLDLSIVLRTPAMHEFRRAVGDDAVICFDASHLLGLLPAIYDLTVFWDDVNVCTASTHKTFPGPQKAVMLTSDAAIIDRMGGHIAFRVSSGHSNSVGALAVTLAELHPDRRQYAEAVIATARSLAEQLHERGLPVAGEAFGFTQTHQIWILPPAGDDPLIWGRRLTACGIRSTTVELPAEGRSGLRLGAQELTRVGIEGDDLAEVADLIALALAATDADHTEAIRRRVGDLANRFPDVRTSF